MSKGSIPSRAFLLNMKKYGEIARVKVNELMYIVYVHKHFSGCIKSYLYIPFFDISISRKTAKKNRGKELEKEALKYSLLNTGFNEITAIKKLEEVIKKYLIKFKPKYIAVCAFKDSKNILNKRIRFYTKRLKILGYKIHTIDKEEEDLVYYFSPVV